MTDIESYKGFTPINPEILRLGKKPGFDLYMSDPNGPALYRQANMEFSREILHFLLEQDVEYLYFKNEEEREYFEYIESNLDNIMADINVPITRKALIVYNTSAYLARQLLISPETADLIRRASRVLDTIVTFTSHDPSTYKKLIDLLPQDYFTHTHSVNVATYSLALGSELGFNVNNGLLELTLGALLHDVGKSRVPQEILNKTGPLSSHEISILKKHVEWGDQIVRNTSSVPFRSYPAISQHHERLDGSGYPASISSPHIFGRIVAVADSFDAMTTNRPYGNAKSSFTAASILKARTNQYDPAVVDALVRVMADREAKQEIAI